MITFTAVKPGNIGNLIIVQMIEALAGPAASAVVTDLGVNQFQIDVTCNNSGAFLQSDMAAALVADPAVSALVVVTADDGSPIAFGFGRLTGGTTGQGQP